MIYEVLGDICAQPHLKTTCRTNHQRRECAGRRLRHRLREIEKRRGGNETVALLAAAVGGRGFERWFDDTRELRRRRTRSTAAPHPKGTTSASTAWPASSHVTDATDWRVEYPFVVLTPTPRAGSGAAGARPHRARPDHHPRGGGTGYTGGACR